MLSPPHRIRRSALRSLCPSSIGSSASALEKDRSRRYESATALAADIQRYLSGEPSSPAPQPPCTASKNSPAKHKPALATAAALALCLLLGTTVSAWQAVRATTAEAQANRQRAASQRPQRDEAQKQRDEVKALNDKLGNDQLQRTLYASNMNLAQHAWKGAGGAARVRDLLEQHRPKPGETDLRGFEWYYLYRVCHSEILTIKGATSYLGGGALAFSPDSKRTGWR